MELFEKFGGFLLFLFLIILVCLFLVICVFLLWKCWVISDMIIFLCFFGSISWLKVMGLFGLVFDIGIVFNVDFVV